MKRRGREVISGTQSEVYPPLPMSWGKETESQQTGHAPRVFCQPLAFAHTTYLRSILHLYRDLQRRATKHRCDNKLRPKTPTSTSARWNLQRIAWLVRKKHRNPRQHFQEHLAVPLAILTLCPSPPPPAPAQLQSAWAPHRPPRRGVGWEPVSPPALGKKTQTQPSSPTALSAAPASRLEAYPGGRGQAAFLPALGSPAACRARSDGERGTLQW